MRSKLPAIYLLILLLGAGCGPADSSPTPPVFVRITPDPTATPALPATDAPTPTPTSIVPDQIELAVYTHSTERFSIAYPENWTPFEQPTGVIFLDPGEEAGYGVTFNDVGEVFTPEELNQYLVSFVAQEFAHREDFTPLSQEQSEDGRVVARFASKDRVLGRAINELRLWQEETIIFVTLISVTEAQWKISHEQLQQLADTLTPLDTTPLETEKTPTPEQPPVWGLIGPTGSQFGFYYATNWEVVKQDETSVAVTMPEQPQITFRADVAELEIPPPEPLAAAQKEALQYVESLSQTRQLPPQEYPLGPLTGITIDYLYQADDGTAMAGSIIVAIEDDKRYRIIFHAPAQYYEAMLQWFNPMLDSFQILPVEEFIYPEEE